MWTEIYVKDFVFSGAIERLEKHCLSTLVHFRKLLDDCICYIEGYIPKAEMMEQQLKKFIQELLTQVPEGTQEVKTTTQNVSLKFPIQNPGKEEIGKGIFTLPSISNRLDYNLLYDRIWRSI